MKLPLPRNSNASISSQTQNVDTPTNYNIFKYAKCSKNVIVPTAGKAIWNAGREN